MSVILNMSTWISSGFLMGLDFNDILQVFLPKGAGMCGEAGGEGWFHAEKTRPIGMKNTLNKALGAVWARPIRRPLATWLHYTQRGFVFGRNFLDNVVDLDSMGRVLAFRLAEHFKPIFALFDIDAAFPSLSHTYLFCVLRAIGVPNVVFNVFK